MFEPKPGDRISCTYGSNVWEGTVDSVSDRRADSFVLHGEFVSNRGRTENSLYYSAMQHKAGRVSWEVLDSEATASTDTIELPYDSNANRFRKAAEEAWRAEKLRRSAGADVTLRFENGVPDLQCEVLETDGVTFTVRVKNSGGS